MQKFTRQGFTLLEVLIAIFLITVGIGGVFTLVWRTTSSTPSTFSKLTAAYLAQEGIELVRNIRDSNWLEAREAPEVQWDDGILCCGASPCECEADYKTIEGLVVYQDRYLKFGGGFYNYETGAPRKFKRKITITKEIDDKLEVKVEVTWQDRGVDNKLIAQEDLYNWL